VTLDVSAEDRLEDICIFDSSYKDITVFSEGIDLHLRYSNTGIVVVQNWHSGETVNKRMVNT
jgi:hypothetical protein